MLSWLRRNPRKKEWKLTVHDAVCVKKSIYGDPDPKEWSTERFQQWHERGVAIISGSTFADKTVYLEERVLDAAAGRKYYDANGLLKRTVLMTLDGLGHASHFEGHHQISGDNKLMVTEFDKAFDLSVPVDLKATLLKAGQAVFSRREEEKQGNTRGKRRVEENGSAMAIAVIEHDESKDQMQCHLANMGDTMAIVLNGETLAIKYRLPGRQYTHRQIGGSTTACPVPVHLIAHNQDALSSETINVSPGDVIVLITDGISDELACETKEQALPEQKNNTKNPYAKTTSAIRYREVAVTDNAFQAALASLKEKAQFNEYDIAAAIIESIQHKLFINRANDFRLQESFNAWKEKHREHIMAHLREVGGDNAGVGGMTSKNKDHYTIQEWFAWKQNHPNTQADDEYPFSEFKEDLNTHLPFLKKCFPDIENIKLENRTVFRVIGEYF